jgi:hypothetical protein
LLEIYKFEEVCKKFVRSLYEGQKKFVRSFANTGAQSLIVANSFSFSSTAGTVQTQPILINHQGDEAISHHASTNICPPVGGINQGILKGEVSLYC